MEISGDDGCDYRIESCMNSEAEGQGTTPSAIIAKAYTERMNSPVQFGFESPHLTAVGSSDIRNAGFSPHKSSLSGGNNVTNIFTRFVLGMISFMRESFTDSVVQLLLPSSGGQYLSRDISCRVSYVTV
jgi:hypothetical protein